MYRYLHFSETHSALFSFLCLFHLKIGVKTGTRLGSMKLHGIAFGLSLWNSVKSGETYPESLNMLLLISHGFEVLTPGR